MKGPFTCRRKYPHEAQTPNWVKSRRRSIRQMYAALRADLQKVRELRAKDAGRNGIWREDADELLEFVRLRHDDAQQAIFDMRTAPVAKYANLSPSAAKRLASRRIC